MNFQEALEISKKFDTEISRLSKILNSYPSNSMGLTPDSVKFSPQYQSDTNNYNKVAKQYREFNKFFMKTFKKEYAAHRAKKYELKARKYAAKQEMVETLDFKNWYNGEDTPYTESLVNAYENAVIEYEKISEELTAYN